MIRVAPFQPEHLAALRVQTAQPDLAQLSEGQRWMIGKQRKGAGWPCFTVFHVNGNMGERLVFCGGAVVSHANLATIWGAFSPVAGPAMLGIERRARRWLASLPQRRIDAVVRDGHAAGHKWIKRLGFVAEARLADYYADGSDAWIYRWEGDRERT